MGQPRKPSKPGRRPKPASADYLADLPTTARPVVAQASTRADGYTIPLHRHRRGQLLHAITGIMRIETADSVWIVPPARALWVPPELAHETSMRGRVEIRTLYIAPAHCRSLPAQAAVVEVSRLLRELILAALEEPPDYADNSRGASIAQLILTELGRLRHQSLTVPMPRDPRALRVARPLLGNCAINLDLDGWAERAGASRRTLARLFRGETGMSFAEWRALLRAVDGMARIAGGASVGEAAASVGYASPSAFSAMVRRSLGQPLRELTRRAEAPASRTIG
jgi:AraC-like DNA-binding protein